MADENERDHLNDMLIEWAPEINRHVYNLKKQGLPPHVTPEDLYSHGMYGLIDAFHNYDPNRGANFATHAAQRIKGKMLDHITSSGGVDHYHYKQAKKLAADSPNVPDTIDTPNPLTNKIPEEPEQ